MNTAKKTVTLAHKTWLAGIGAYDSTREKAANKFDQIFVDGSALVNGLLEKGESVEIQLQAKLEARKMLQDKIAALRAKLGFGNESRDQQIESLTQRVDSLIEVVAKLAQQQAAEKKPAPTKKAPVKRATAAKAPVKTADAATTTAKPAAKTAAKKAPAKPRAAKPAATKTATKPAAAKTATKPAAKAKD
jgi:hypothetical protein